MASYRKPLIPVSIVLSTALLTIGCSAPGPMFQPAEIRNDSALVYVYRNSKVVGSGNVFTLVANGKPVADIANGSYYPLYAPAGEIQFMVVQHLRPPLVLHLLSEIELKDKVKLTVSVQNNSVRYVRLNHGGGYVNLESVPDSVGREEIRGLNLASANESQ